MLGEELLLHYHLIVPLALARGKGGGSNVPLYDIVLIILALLACGYWILEFREYNSFRIGFPIFWDTFFGWISIILVFEATRLVTGNVLLAVGLVFSAAFNWAVPPPGVLAPRGC